MHNAQSIDPLHARNYLTRRGWKPEPAPSGDLWVLKAPWGQEREVTIPQSTTAGDYAARMHEIIRDAAELQGKSQEEVSHELLLGTFHHVRFTRSGNPGTEGDWPMPHESIHTVEAGVRLIEEAARTASDRVEAASIAGQVRTTPTGYLGGATELALKTGRSVRQHDAVLRLATMLRQTQLELSKDRDEEHGSRRFAEEPADLIRQTNGRGLTVTIIWSLAAEEPTGNPDESFTFDWSDQWKLWSASTAPQAKSRN